MDWTSLDRADEEGEPHFLPRRTPRFAMDEPSVLRGAGGVAVPVRIHDLSHHGFMASCRERVLIGSYVTLDLPGVGGAHAQVRWQVGGRLGGKFLDPVALHRCNWLAAQASG